MSVRLGSQFWEQITQEKNLFHHRQNTDTWDEIHVEKRITILTILFLIVSLALFARLFYLTIVEGERFRKTASENRIREAKIEAPRGIIYDRNANPLVGNIPAFIDKSGFRVVSSGTQTAKTSYVETVTRDYLYTEVLAHVIGYIGEAEASETDYQMGDSVGKIGIEHAYDTWLRGTDGKQLYEVDAAGEIERTLGKIESTPGRNLQLTLDVGIQLAAWEALKDVVGAVVVSDPKTGEIFALVSSPSFDPNKFITGDLGDLLKRTDQPLFNRVLSGQYPPGSIFKIVTAMAGLESGKITKNLQIEDTGVLTIGQFSFGNWYFSQFGRKEGFLDVVGALKRSNDIYFYKAGEATGIETISTFAKRLGLGSPTGIDIKGEEEGLMPDPSWRKKEKGEDWFLGNTYHVAIGQGDILMTPIQVNLLTNLVANNGVVCRPHLAKTKNFEPRTQNSGCKNLEIKKETVDLVREGMKQACATGGTGWPLVNFQISNIKYQIDNIDFFEGTAASGSATKRIQIPVACKTGTAEFGDPKNRTHAWFTAFAPVYNPQISVTVLIEGGGEGSTNAAPIAKKILEKWFEK